MKLNVLKMQALVIYRIVIVFLRELGIDGRIILRLILRNLKGVREWTRFIWPIVGFRTVMNNSVS
jgi:hypothetical protein